MQQEAEILAELGAPVFEATDAQPGSPAKIAILEQRARFGQPLWHPGDKQGPVRLHAPVLNRYRPPKGWHPLGWAFAESKKTNGGLAP